MHEYVFGMYMYECTRLYVYGCRYIHMCIAMSSHVCVGGYGGDGERHASYCIFADVNPC